MNKLWMTAGLALATVLTGCGGGGGFDPEPGPTERLRMTPSIKDVGIFAGYGYKVARISHGVEPYYTMSNSSSVSAELDADKYLYLFGNSAMSDTSKAAVVSVQDSSVNQVHLDLNVTVYGYQLASSAGTSVSLMPSQTFTTTISGGEKPYPVVSDKPAIATATIDSEGRLVVTGVSAGDAAITVTDSVGNAVVVSVNVQAAVLTLSPSSGSGNTGSQLSFNVSGGKGPYTAASDNLSIARAAVNGSTVKVDLLAAGSAKITVTDSIGTVQTYTVTAKAPVVVVTGTTAINETNKGTLNLAIKGGTAPYTAALTRADQALFSATVVETASVDNTDPAKPVTTYSYTLELGLGTAGNRCVAADRVVEVIVSDAKGETTIVPITVRDMGTCP